jgi:alkyl hydroperoxide reductase subunit AhpC
MAARVQFPILADTDHAVSDAFDAFNLLEDPIMQNEATPAVFIINKDGQFVWSEIAENTE